MKQEPIFLDVEEVIEIHQDQIGEHGGSPGIRDMDLLASAVGMPQSGAFGQYAHADLYEMAAAYLFHLAKNHPFVDGNKRVAGAVAETFLQANGLALTADEPEYADFVLRVAAGEATKADAAEFYRQNTRPADPKA